MTYNITKPFLYTLLVFLALCLASYVASAQPVIDRAGKNAASAGGAVLPGTPETPVSLSLNDALHLAMDHNREIRVAGLDIARASEEKTVARSLRLPSAGITGQVSHYFSLSPFFGLGNASGDKVPYGRYGGKDQFTATLWASQPLYNPASRPSLLRSEKLEEQSRYLLSDKQTAVTADVRQTYLRILVLGERIRLQKESLGRNQKALADARSLLAQGRALRVDTLRAFTSVKNLEPDLLRLSYAIEVGKLQLKTLVGIDSAQDISLSDSLVLPDAVTIPDEEVAYAEAEQNRPDLRALSIQPAIDDQQIRLADAARKPSLSLVGQYNVQTQANRFNYFDALYPSTPYVGALISVPLFSGNANLAKVRSARLARLQSTTRYENARQQLKAAIRQAVADAKEAASRIQTRITVKETAQLSYDITQYRYANGVASRLELTDAELALTTAQSNYLEAIYDYIAALIELDRTRGRQKG